MGGEWWSVHDGAFRAPTEALCETSPHRAP